MTSVDVFTLLLTVAQVSVAFAGFGAIASGISRRSEEDSVDAGRLINMMVTALSVTILALLPCALALFALPEDWVWRASAVAALITFMSFAPGVVSRVKRMTNMAGFHRRATYTSYALLALAILLFMSCALGLPAGDLDASYSTALLALLTATAILFFRMVFSLLREVRPD